MDLNFEFVMRYWAVLVATAARWFDKDVEKEAIALAYGFHIYLMHREDDMDPRFLAYRAVKAVQRGRDLPGVVTNNHQPDAMDHALQGAGMDGARDRHPGPDKLAEQRDEVRHLRSLANADEAIMLDMMLEGDTQAEVARHLGVRKHTITDRKMRLAERAKR